MSAAALDYQINTYLGSNEPLLVYYDFNNSSVFTAQSGSTHQAYLRNVYPSPNTGAYYGKIVGATGASSGAAMTLATGAGGFLTSGEGDFRKNSVEISGSSSIPINYCSYLFSIEPDLSKDGVIFGSFEKVVETAGSQQIVSSKGFNLGTTARGQIFLQSLSRDGEYCFVTNNFELAPKNVIGVNFSESQARIFRFDYLNDKIYTNEFSLDTTHIQNNNLYLGSSVDFYRNSGQKLYSGKMDEFLLFNGQVPQSVLFEIGKGLVSEYYYSSGAVTSGQVVSGYNTSFIYKTGVTGAYANITGYTSVRSGVEAFTQSILFTGNVQVKEGDRFYKNYTSYLEEQGFLSGINADKYSPTGDAAFATLGLQAGNTSSSGYSLSQSFSQSNINIPLYQMVYLTGITDQISGIVNTPIYNTIYSTGAAVSGVTISGNIDKLQKNYIYYMGNR